MLDRVPSAFHREKRNERIYVFNCFFDVKWSMINKMVTPKAKANGCWNRTCCWKLSWRIGKHANKMSQLHAFSAWFLRKLDARCAGETRVDVGFNGSDLWWSQIEITNVSKEILPQQRIGYYGVYRVYTYFAYWGSIFRSNSHLTKNRIKKLFFWIWQKYSVSKPNPMEFCWTEKAEFIRNSSTTEHLFERFKSKSNSVEKFSNYFGRRQQLPPYEEHLLGRVTCRQLNRNGRKAL